MGDIDVPAIGIADAEAALDAEAEADYAAGRVVPHERVRVGVELATHVREFEGLESGEERRRLTVQGLETRVLHAVATLQLPDQEFGEIGRAHV